MKNKAINLFGYLFTLLLTIGISIYAFFQSPYINEDLSPEGIVGPYFYYLPAEIAGFFTYSYGYSIMPLALIVITIYYALFFIPLCIYLLRRKPIWLIIQMLVVSGQILFVAVIGWLYS